MDIATLSTPLVACILCILAGAGITAYGIKNKKAVAALAIGLMLFAGGIVGALFTMPQSQQTPIIVPPSGGGGTNTVIPDWRITLSSVTETVAGDDVISSDEHSIQIPLAHATDTLENITLAFACSVIPPAGSTTTGLATLFYSVSNTDVKVGATTPTYFLTRKTGSNGPSSTTLSDGTVTDYNTGSTSTDFTTGVTTTVILHTTSIATLWTNGWTTLYDGGDSTFVVEFHNSDNTWSDSFTVTFFLIS